MCGHDRSVDIDAQELVPPDAERSAVPRSLLAFAPATLIGVCAVLVVVWVKSPWGVAFALLLIVVVLALVLGDLELGIAGGRPQARERRRPPLAPSAPAEWTGPRAEHRLLLVVSAAVDGPRLARLLAGERGAAVLVVAPALHRTRLRYWVSDSDEAIEHARAVEQQTVHMLRREDVPSSGHVGSSDPVKAIEDALRFFDADRIAIAMHTTGKRRYRERELRAEAERRFGRPVITLEPAAA